MGLEKTYVKYLGWNCGWYEMSMELKNTWLGAWEVYTLNIGRVGGGEVIFFFLDKEEDM